MIGTGQFLLGAVFAPLVGLGGKSSGLPMAVVIFALSLGAVLMRVLLVRTPRVELVAEPLVA
ncbi:hypothetical protein ACFQ9X_03230 [Catenulispora yoronensis]